MKITFLGHASFSIEAHGKTLIVDPYITDNELAKNIDIKKTQIRESRAIFSSLCSILNSFRSMNVLSWTMP